MKFDIDPVDAVAIARLNGAVTILKLEHEKAASLLAALYAHVREKAKLPVDAEFTWDETGLKGSYEPKEEKNGE